MDHAEADRRLAANQADFAALAAKGDLFVTSGDLRAAGAHYSMAMAVAQSDPSVPARDAARIAAALDDIQRRFIDHLVASLDQDGFPRSEWHPRFAKALAIMFGQVQRPPVSQAYPQMPNVLFYPDLPYVEFADVSDFAWREAVEGATEGIRAEAEALLSGEGTFRPYVRTEANRPQGDMHGMLDNDDWSSLDLVEKGEKVEQHVAHAPIAYRTITEEVPVCAIPGRAPSLLLSLLRPGKAIPPHHGMLNCRYICHLPLIVPGNGALRLGTQTREWEQGKLLAFDDTIEHEAWNRSGEDRVVLIFDVWRPELETIEQAQIAALFRAVDRA